MLHVIGHIGERAAADPLARVVKIADLRDNMDMSRIPDPTPQDWARREKYERALKRLEILGPGFDLRRLSHR